MQHIDVKNLSVFVCSRANLAMAGVDTHEKKPLLAEDGELSTNNSIRKRIDNGSTPAALQVDSESEPKVMVMHLPWQQHQLLIHIND